LGSSLKEEVIRTVYKIVVQI